MRIGLDHYTIAHRQLSPEATLQFARERGFEGVQFLDPAAIDPELNLEGLAAFRELAGSLGLYLEVGLPCPNPIRRGRELGRPVDSNEHARELARHVEAAAALGCRHARAYVGDRHSRFRTDVSWIDQRNATMEVIRLLAPALRACQLRVAIETHADQTVEELSQMVEALGPELAGVTLDTGNLLMRLDEPLHATERLAPFVLATHIKDAVLAFTPRGLCWQARPVGSGIVPIPDMLAILKTANGDLNLSIELHPRTYDLPIYDPTWLAFFPDLHAPALAAIVHLGALCEKRYAQNELERPEVVEAVPWADRDLDWLARSVGYLRPMVEMLKRL